MTLASRHTLSLAVAALFCSLPAAAQCGQWSDEHAVGVDLNARILRVFDLGQGPELFLGGDFLMVGSASVRGVARWTGTGWTDVGAFQGRFVSDLEVFDPGSGPELFIRSGGYSSITSGIHSWDGVSWQLLTDEGRSIHTWDDGSGEALYVGLFSIAASSGTIYGLARWDGTDWTDLGLPAQTVLTPLLNWDDGSGDALYLSGYVVDYATLGVWRYDGVSFTQVGASFAREPTALAVHDDGSGEALYAAGEGPWVSGKYTGEVHRWDGASWVQVGPSASDEVKAIVSYDAGDGQGPGLYIGGSFQKLGGVPVSRLARWDGQAWQEVAGGVDKWVGTLLPFNDGSDPWPSLWMAGALTSAAGTPSLHVAELEQPCACQGTSYCTAGTTANGCAALISSTGTASLTASSGFTVDVSGAEGGAPGVLFFGTSGEQATPWGTGTSYRCVVPPVVRTGLNPGSGNPGLCDGSFALDFNAWMAAKPGKAPLAGQTALLQCWFRDPGNTSNQVTSFSDALRVSVCP